MGRLTIRNANGTYRVPLGKIEVLRVEAFGTNSGVFGDIVNRLGEYEDKEADKNKQKK